MRKGTADFAVYWRVFCSSGHKEKTKGLVIENFIKYAKENKDNANKHIKTICNPIMINYVEHVHYPLYWQFFWNKYKRQYR